MQKEWGGRGKKEEFFAYSFLKVHLHNSLKIKVIKKSQKSRNQIFLNIFA
jgi:hypothetical protein